MASEQIRLTASGAVGTSGKTTFLKSVVVEGTGTATFRDKAGGAGTTVRLLIPTGSWTAGDDDGVAYIDGLDYVKGAETSVSVEYSQRS